MTTKPDSRFFSQVAEMLLQAREHVARQVNSAMVLTYFEIGRMIVEEEQKGKERAGYGEELLKGLSEYLTKEFGRGYSMTNLHQMRTLYQVYSIPQTASEELGIGESGKSQTVSGESSSILQTPSEELKEDKALIQQTVSAEFDEAKGQTPSDQLRKSETLSRKFTLSWSYYLIFMRILNGLTLIAVICLANLSFGQNRDDIEDMKIRRDRTEAIYPSIVSDTSKHNKESELKGFRLVELQPSPCSSEATYDLLQRMKRVSFHNDTLDIELSIVANCCASFIGEIEVQNDTTLNLILIEYGLECFCHCCFDVTYRVETKHDVFSDFRLNGRIVSLTDRVFKERTEEKELYENGELKSLTHKLEGEIQEIIYYDRLGKVTQRDFYRNGEPSHSFIDGKAFRPDGTVLWDSRK